MFKSLQLKKCLLLLAMVMGVGSAWAEDVTWVKTAIGDLVSNDVVVIVSTKDDASYAMSNNKGTSSAPSAVEVTLNGDEISGDVENTIQWVFTATETEGNFKFSVGSNYLYCTNTNNGVRVGTNANNVFSIDSESGYLFNNATSRYIGVYNNQDWRCYTSINANIKDQTFAFYKKVTKAPDPSKTDVTLSFPQPSYTADIEVGFTAPELTKSADVAVTYSSSVESVAIVDASTGAVTLKGKGVTEITASFAGDDTYNSASASYTLTVTGVETLPYTQDFKTSFDNWTQTGTVWTQNSSYGAVANATAIGTYDLVSPVILLDADKQINVAINHAGRYLNDAFQEECKLMVKAADDEWEEVAISTWFTNTNWNYVNAEMVLAQKYAGKKVQFALRYAPATTPEEGAKWEIKTFTVSAAETPKEVPTLAFGQEAYSVDVNGVLTITATSTNSNGAITYSSSDTSVADIDLSTGAVSPHKAGTTTITATIAETDNYASTTATVELTVIDNTIVPADLTLDFTSAWTEEEDNADGEKVFTKDSYTISGKGVDNFKFNSGYFFFGKSGAYINLPKVDFDVEKIEVVGRGGASGNVKHNIFVGEDAVSTEVTGITGTNTFEIAEEAQAANTQYVLKVTSNHNAQVTYIKYYKKNTVVTATIGEAGYATYVAKKNVSFLGSGVKAYVAKYDGSYIKLTQIDKVPAGKPVILEAEAGAYTLNEIEAVDDETVQTINDNNQLAVSDGTIKGANIYVLANKTNGVGFYNWTSEQALPAGKVYMLIEATGREFIGFGGEATGIESVAAQQAAQYYDLQGRRVAQPTKGLYIVNGKKMVVK